MGIKGIKEERSNRDASRKGRRDENIIMLEVERSALVEILEGEDLETDYEFKYNLAKDYVDSINQHIAECKAALKNGIG